MSAEPDTEPVDGPDSPSAAHIAAESPRRSAEEPSGPVAGPEDGEAGPRRRNRALPAAAVAVAVAAAVAVTATLLTTGGSGSEASGKHPARPAADGLTHTTVDISRSTCGRGWTTGHPGQQVFDLHNSTINASEVYLSDPASGRIFGEVDGLAPGTTRPMVVDLGSGSYAFQCLEDDADEVTGPTVTVPGSLPQGPSSLPVNQHDLIPPTLDYQKWIGSRTVELASRTAVLKKDIDGGDLAAARRDWLTAHLVYERMGAAYDTFGDADGAINGTVSLAPGAAADPDFTGFHRIEYGLWHGASAASLKGPAAQLDKDVRDLRDGWSQQRMDPAAMGLRAHEIIENAEQFELTARTDYGSGTNLATASANIDGTREILSVLNALLAPRDAGLAQLDASLDRAQADLGALRRGGVWTPVSGLTQARRERIDADFGDLLEQLAPVATIFEVRRTA